jgi:hypothetical protein
MAGKNVRKYLEAKRLRAFYDLYHGLSESILGSSKNLTGYIGLLPELQNSNMNSCADADACIARSKDALLSIDDFFWPLACDEIEEYKLREDCQMKRWEPFDGIAWDSMFAQLASTLTASLQIWQGCYEKLRPVHLEQMRNPETIASIMRVSEGHIDYLSRMCNQAWVEFDIFHNWFLARLRQVGSILDGAVSGIECILKSEAVSVPDDEFRQGLDELTAAVVKFEDLISPYRNPAIRFTDLSLRREEAEWDAVWAEVAETLETVVKGLRGHLANLRRHPFAQSAAASAIHERFTEIENALDAFSQIILEMRYQAPLAVLSPKRT